MFSQNKWKNTVAIYMMSKMDSGEEVVINEDFHFHFIKSPIDFNQPEWKMAVNH